MATSKRLDVQLQENMTGVIKYLQAGLLNHKKEIQELHTQFR